MPDDPPARLVPAMTREHAVARTLRDVCSARPALRLHAPRAFPQRVCTRGKVVALMRLRRDSATIHAR